MVDVELKRKVRISREDAARRLIALGEALTAGDEVQLEDEGNSIRFAVAGEVEWEFELEVEDDETELEIEMKWSNSPSAEEAPAPEPTAAEKAAAIADEG
ncbi:MAG: amphi-Trp domain-containing protein [Frankiaceae bacterium]